MRSITLSWPQPEQPNGIILDYEIRYYEKVSRICTPDVSSTVGSRPAAVSLGGNLATEGGLRACEAWYRTCWGAAEVLSLLGEEEQRPAPNQALCWEGSGWWHGCLNAHAGSGNQE